MLDLIDRQQIESSFVLAAVLLAPNRTASRIDVMATYMRVVHAMALSIEPEHWGPSIKEMRARELVNDDMGTIHPNAALSTFYEVPHEYAKAAEAAWNEA